MPDLASMLERESRSVEPPDGFDRLVRRRDRRRRNRRIGTVLVALVLAAVATGGLVRAFQGVERGTPAVTPRGCPPGSNPDEPGPVDQVRPDTGEGFAGRMVFDIGSGKIVLIQTTTERPLLSAAVERVQPWAFDVCTNTWSRMAAGPVHLWPTALVYDVDSDLTIAIEAGSSDVSVWAYDLDRNAWTENGSEPIVARAGLQAVYDPVSGDVIVRDPATSSMWTYDVDTDTWVELEQEGGVPPTPKAPSKGMARWQLLSYDASVDRLVLVCLYEQPCAGTWEFDPRARTWSKSPARTPVVSFGYYLGGNGAVYDEVNARTLIYSYGTVVAYEAGADRWHVVYGSAAGWNGNLRRGFDFGVGRLHRTYGSVAYDAVNARLLTYGGTARMQHGWKDPDDVWAFDLGRGEWIELLAPTHPYDG